MPFFFSSSTRLLAWTTLAVSCTAFNLSNTLGTVYDIATSALQRAPVYLESVSGLCVSVKRVCVVAEVQL